MNCINNALYKDRGSFVAKTTVVGVLFNHLILASTFGWRLQNFILLVLTLVGVGGQSKGTKSDDGEM